MFKISDIPWIYIYISAREVYLICRKKAAIYCYRVYNNIVLCMRVF